MYERIQVVTDVNALVWFRRCSDPLECFSERDTNFEITVRYDLKLHFCEVTQLI